MLIAVYFVAILCIIQFVSKLIGIKNKNQTHVNIYLKILQSERYN